MQTEIWAHRGSSHTFIENTLAAFKQAIKDQSEGVELDVQRTADGELVVFHDENLARLTGDTRFLWDLTWKEIQALNLSSPAITDHAMDNDSIKIPRLEDVLVLVKSAGIKVNIELKNSINVYQGMEEEVVTLVDRLAMQDQVIYSSFNHESVNKLSHLTRPEYCGLLTSDIIYQPWKYLLEVGAGAYHPMINSLQQENLVQYCRENHIKIHAWTADKEPYINACLLLGVDAIITNEPQLALQLRQKFIEDQGKSARDR